MGVGTITGVAGRHRRQAPVARAAAAAAAVRVVAAMGASVRSTLNGSTEQRRPPPHLPSHLTEAAAMAEVRLKARYSVH